jgi:RNA polymerase sigma-70 factor (ECF subfamily)
MARSSEESGGRRGLVAKAMDGDPAALDDLWRDSAPWVSAVVIAHLPAGEPVEGDLEDVLQEVAMAMVTRISTLREPGSFAPWLRSIALNIARNTGRKASRRRRRDTRSPTPNAGEPAPQGDIDAAVNLMRHLPEHAREALMLRAVRGLSQAQIAEVLGVPVKTVETRLRRARQALRRAMIAEEGASTGPEPARSER